MIVTSVVGSSAALTFIVRAGFCLAGAGLADLETFDVSLATAGTGGFDLLIEVSDVLAVDSAFFSAIFAEEGEGDDEALADDARGEGEGDEDGLASVADADFVSGDGDPLADDVTELAPELRLGLVAGVAVPELNVKVLGAGLRDFEIFDVVTFKFELVGVDPIDFTVVDLMRLSVDFEISVPDFNFEIESTCSTNYN